MSVPRRMTEKMKWRGNIPYERRLKLLNTHSLARCRLREGFHKSIQVNEGYKTGLIVTIGLEATGSSLMKLIFKRWNKLSSNQVVNVSTGSFKRKLQL